MSIRPCENQFEGCPYGFTDQHHIYKLADADTPLKRLYANLGCNVMELCRCVHTELEATVGWLPYPSEGVMLDTIAEQIEEGRAQITASKQKKIGL